LFAFPGVWTRYRGPIKKNGENVEQEVFAFMTTEPNELTASINHERMPVLLSSPDHFETWMNGTPTEAFSLAKSFAPDAMRIVRADAPYRSGKRPEWIKTKCAAWKDANRDRYEKMGKQA
jgi:putative SOS response-associated peptidase YedK